MNELAPLRPLDGPRGTPALPETPLGPPPLPQSDDEGWELFTKFSESREWG